MQEILQLKQFHFTAPVSTAMVSRMQDSGSVAAQLPLMHIDIDFVHGKFNMDGNWQFILNASKHNAVEQYASNQRVFIQTDVFSGLDKRNNSRACGDYIFCLNGFITIEESKRACTGLLVVERGQDNSRVLASHWFLCGYLYDCTTDEYEISFRLPFFAPSKNNLS